MSFIQVTNNNGDFEDALKINQNKAKSGEKVGLVLQECFEAFGSVSAVRECRSEFYTLAAA